MSPKPPPNPLQQTVDDLKAELAAAEGALDIINRENHGEDDDELAIEYGGTGWEYHDAVVSTRAIRDQAKAWMHELARLQDLREMQLQAANATLDERRALRKFLAEVEMTTVVFRDLLPPNLLAMLTELCTAARKVVRL